MDQVDCASAESVRKGRRNLTPSISEQVRNIAADLFAVPLDTITDESSPENLEAWDSAQHLTLVLALEEKFQFQLSPEEIDQMHNIGQIVNMVASKLQTAPS